MEHAAERFDNAGNGLDLRVIFVEMILICSKALSILSLGILLVISPHATFSFGDQPPPRSLSSRLSKVG